MGYDEGFIIGQIIAWIFILGSIAATVFFNISLMGCVNQCSSQNQKVQPWVIWLNFIPVPVFNSMITLYFCFNASLSANLQAGKNIASTTMPFIFSGSSILAFIILMTATSVSGKAEGIYALITFLLFVTGLITWIIYWVQMNRVKKQLELGTTGSRDSEILDADFRDEEEVI